MKEESEMLQQLDVALLNLRESGQLEDLEKDWLSQLNLLDQP